MVQSIQRAIAILRCFSETEPEIGVTVLSDKLDLPKSTISRILSALQIDGFVEQNPETGKYRLGLGLISLAGVALGRLDVRGVAQPYLIELVKLSGETVNVSVMDGKDCVYIEREPSPNPLRYVGWIGRRTPIHCTASGKVFLAHMLLNERVAILPKTLTKFTEHTLTTLKTLAESLTEVYQQGVAIVHEEFDEGFSAIAAPVYNHAAQVIAAIVISGPTFRMTPERIQDMIPSLRQTAADISSKMGYSIPTSQWLLPQGSRAAGRQ